MVRLPPDFPGSHERAAGRQGAELSRGGGAESAQWSLGGEGFPLEKSFFLGRVKRLYEVI